MSTHTALTPVSSAGIARNGGPEWMKQLTLGNIQKYICPTATESELFMFFNLCKMRNLNPFMKEAYLVKYGNAPASMIVSKDAFMQKADVFPTFDGFKAGVVIIREGALVYQEGSFSLPEDELIGGWAEVYRKDRGAPFRAEVALAEYVQAVGQSGKPGNWQKKPLTMIRKVALVQAMREAFPNAYSGMYSEEEMPPIDIVDDRPVITRAQDKEKPVEVDPLEPMPESDHHLDDDPLYHALSTLFALGVTQAQIHCHIGVLTPDAFTEGEAGEVIALAKDHVSYDTIEAVLPTKAYAEAWNVLTTFESGLPECDGPDKLEAHYRKFKTDIDKAPANLKKQALDALSAQEKTYAFD